MARVLWMLSPVQKPDPSCLQFVTYTLNVIIAHHFLGKQVQWVGQVRSRVRDYSQGYQGCEMW